MLAFRHDMHYITIDVAEVYARSSVWKLMTVIVSHDMMCVMIQQSFSYILSISYRG